MTVAFLAVLADGVLRRWRWTFWLIVVAFAFWVVRSPSSVLELVGIIPAGGPPWYLLFQAGVGLI